MSAPAATADEDLAGSPGEDFAGEPRPSPREVDHPDLAKRGGEAAIVVDLLGELDGAAIRLLGAVEVRLGRGAAV